MTISQIHVAAMNFKAGTVSFNKGNKVSILFGDCWFPARAMARHICGRNVTTEEAIFLFTDVLFVKTKRIDYNSNFPVPLSPEEKLFEIRELATSIIGLS